MQRPRIISPYANPEVPIDLGNALLQEKARRNQKIAERIETPARRILGIIENDPGSITQDKELFKEACESLLWILDKKAKSHPIRFNRSQLILLDAYFEMREDNEGSVLINILKGRQQGMSTAIGAFACMEMLAHPNTGALIASEEKGGSGENIFYMYERYFQLLQKIMHLELDEEDYLWPGDITSRFNFGDSCELYNGSKFKVVGEKLVTSRTLQFIHLSEAAFFNNLNNCMGMLLQTMPKQSIMFIETTAKEYGNNHYDTWMGSCSGQSSFKPLFLPWFIHEEYSEDFKSEEEKSRFIMSLGQSDDHDFGNEAELLELDATKSDWYKYWNKIDMRGNVTPTYENLKWRRTLIRKLNGNINEFNRQYPTLPEMAFLANTSHVFDMNAIRWYQQNQVVEPERGNLVERVDGLTSAQYNKDRTGILSIWEHPLPYSEYVIGVDVAEGNDSGDFSCAYVLRRMPFRIVCRLRGYDGRRIGIKEFSRQLYWLGKYYNNAWICPENNNDGSAVVQNLLEWGCPKLMPEGMITKEGQQSRNRYGWRNSSKMRDIGIGETQDILSSRHVGIPDELFIDEAHHFVYVNGRPQAARKGQNDTSTISLPGTHDDGIFAFISAIIGDKALPLAKTEEEMKYKELLAKNKVQERYKKQSTTRGSDWLQYV